MTQTNISDEYDNEIIERKPRVYQLEIKEIWTPNLVIAKYNVNRDESKRIDIWDRDFEEEEYNKFLNYISSLEKYFNNVLDFYDRVILSSNNLKEIIKPGDIIQTDYIYKENPFKLNENTTIFIFKAYEALYPRILVKNIVKSIFDPLYNQIKPGDGLFFTIYILLRSADVSFREFKNVWDFMLHRDRVKYSKEINVINNSFEKYINYIEFVKNFLIHHFPFDNYNIPKDIFDNKTIDNLIENLEPLRIIAKKIRKKKGKREEDFDELEEEEYEEPLDIKLPKGGDLYKDLETFKKGVIESLGGNHPLIRAYLNYKLLIT
jgi:hypothetical protein